MSDAARSREPRFSPTIALLTVSRTAELEIARVLEPHGLTLRKYGLLGHVSSTPGLSLSELARRSKITVQSVHSLVAALQSAGLVTSSVVGSGHAAQLAVTPTGSDVLDRVAREVEELDARLFDSDGMRDLSAGLLAAMEERFGLRGAPQD